MSEKVELEVAEEGFKRFINNLFAPGGSKTVKAIAETIASGGVVHLEMGKAGELKVSGWVRVPLWHWAYRGKVEEASGY